MRLKIVGDFRQRQSETSVWRRLLLALSAMAALGACEAKPTETAITPELLEDPMAVQRVANRLPPEDRALFTRYVTGRVASTAMGLPPLVNSAGNDPSTVQEAIALQRWSDGVLAEYDRAIAPHNAVMANMGEGLTTDQYNASVQAINEAQARMRATLEAGPPAAP